MTKARDTGEVLNTRGTAATADVQSSPTDSATGKVMLTGAFGLGTDSSSYIGAAEDADTYRTSGTYYGGFTNAPTTGTAWLAVIGNELGTGRCRQVWRSSFDGLVYERATNGAGVFLGWDSVYTEANLNPNVFGGSAGGIVGVVGLAQNATTLLVPLPISNTVKPPSISKGVGSYTVRNSAFGLHASGITAANVAYLSGNSSPKTALIAVTTTGLSSGGAYYLLADATSSTIQVN